MIKLIIRKWIKDYENVNDKNVREAYVVLSGVVGIICNLLLFVTKLSIGLLINSIAVISDAFNNITDVGSSLVSILTAKLANRPPDEAHPYGHGRFEYIGSLCVAFIIFSVGYQLMLNSYDKLIHPEKITFSTLTIIILILSVLVKLWMFSYNMYIAKKIKSSINKATAFDSINDSIATSLVIAAMIIGAFTDLPVDGVAGILISLLILYSGFDIARDTVNLLLGSAAEPKVADRINQIIRAGKHVIGTHELEIHDYGPGRKIASIHAEVPDYLNIVEGHSSIDELEQQIAEEFGMDIIVHMDPISTDIEKVEKVKRDIIACISEAEMGIKILNFRIAQAEKGIIVIFDLEVSSEIPESEYGKIKKTIREKIEETCDSYRVVINRVNGNNSRTGSNMKNK